VKAAFVPEAGDFVWLTFDPQAAANSRAAPGTGADARIYNAKSGLALACPSRIMPRIPIRSGRSAGHGATGVILADHVKSVDWKARRAEKLGHCTNEVIDEVRARLAPCSGLRRKRTNGMGVLR